MADSANIIDAFVVTLGLDPRNYQREIKAYRDDRKRLAEEEAKQNQRSLDGQKRMTEGLRSLRNETAGFLFLLAGANSVKDFAANILTGDAATGRLAKNLGLATEQVSAWEGAIRRVGGSASDIDGALRSMSSAFQSLQLTGTTGHDADFQGLGVNARDLQNPEGALLKIADASSRMGRPEFNARLSRLGFDQNTINLLAKGRQGVTALLEEQRKLGVATDKDAENAQKFQDALAKLTTAIEGSARPAIEELAGIVADFAKNGDNVKTAGEAVAAGMAAIGVAALAAYWPVAALAGAIFLVMKAKHDWEHGDPWVKLGHEDPAKVKQQEQDPSNPRGKGLWGGLKAMWNSPWFSIKHAGDTPAPAAAGVSPPPPSAGSDAIQRYWMGKGFTATAARGIVAAMRAENPNFDPNNTGPDGGTLGIGQWRGPRKRALIARYGPHPTLQQQLDFMWSEMQGGDAIAARGVPQMQRAGSSGAAAQAMIDSFYRPGGGTQGDYDRAGRYLGQTVGVAARRGSGAPTGATTQTTSVGQIIVYTAATDADGIAHDMRGALAKRGLVVQANTGLAQ